MCSERPLSHWQLPGVDGRLNEFEDAKARQNEHYLAILPGKSNSYDSGRPSHNHARTSNNTEGSSAHSNRN